MRLSREARETARALVARRLGLHFPEERDDDLARKLARAAGATTGAQVGRYLSRLETQPEDSPDWRRLTSQLTVGETYFLRDRACFDALEHDVLPALIERRRRAGTRRLRIWSAGCASGEEPYSLAILVDRLLPDRADWSVTILGTDVDPEALAAARRALYREWSLRETPAAVRQRYFRPHGPRTFELDPAIRKLVTLAPLNLAEDVYPSHATNTSAIDLILCRNVLMYFTPHARDAAVARFSRALVEGGWFVVSPAEASAQLMEPLRPVSFPGALFFRKSAEPAAAAAPPPARTVRQATPPPKRQRRASSASVSQREQRQAAVDGSLLARASAEAGRGNLDPARELCLEALAGDRLDPGAYVLLAEIEQERGDVAAAVDAIRRAIYLVPDSPSAHFVLGSLLFRQGQRAKARRSMETVVALVEHAPADEEVPGADGLTAGRLLETATSYLESW